MVGPTTNPLGFTVDPLWVNLMPLQDEEGWVDAELSMAQVADLQVNSETVTGSSAFVS